MAPESSVERFNTDCLCFSLDRSALARALEAELGSPALAQQVGERCAGFFAEHPVFVSAAHIQRMARVVQAIEAVVALPAYRQEVLAGAPTAARIGHPGPQSAFFGYDFHLDQGVLGLIEINTNAGGAMLNAVLARAQRQCCQAMEGMVPTLASVALFEQRMVDMFRREWRLAGNDRPAASLAIVDRNPEQQYLYPEFLLFQRLFERHGLSTVIADPEELQWRGGRLWHGEVPIDLVYNRLTDFYLEQPESAALRAAHEAQAVVLTPHPRAHALYADKRLLAIFSDDDHLKDLGADVATREVLLAHVPHTEVVRPEHGERLWADRRNLFFKPLTGFGSRAAYRGDKLTKRVWQDILATDYVAQAMVAPGQRLIEEDSVAKNMKFDLRAYAYAGQVQWVAARLYQGQTTNFRTPGGGFAPVYSTVDGSGHRLPAPVAEYASFVFLLDADGGVHPLPHALYTALARHEANAPSLAGQSLRLADWYVRLQATEPAEIVNETYGLVQVDAQGRLDWAAAPPKAGWPSWAEREQMRAALRPAAGQPI